MKSWITFTLWLIALPFIGCAISETNEKAVATNTSRSASLISNIESGEVLYNGIVLPAQWPPEIPVSRKPMPVPYLEMPPAVIPINVGRQLFIDDFLIYNTTMTRQFHTPVYVDFNPVMKASYDWEWGIAMTYSDGIWWDPADQKFKMWYLTKGFHDGGTAYAESFDGINWEKPDLGIIEGTSYVLKEPRDSATIWLDHFAQDPEKRFVLARTWDINGWRLAIHTSPDGIHWSEPAISSSCGDRTTIFYNPFRKKWVFSLRGGTSLLGRSRFYHESDDPIEGTKWVEKNLFSDDSILAPGPKFWCGTDREDPPMEAYKTATQLYNLDAVAYESVMLGFFSVWHGQFKEVRPKPDDVVVGFSRDGFHWHKPFRKPFLPISQNEDDWNWGNVQSAGGGCLIVGDKLYFYCSGRTRNQWSTGLATMRRDGFASMNADDSEQTLLTRPLIFDKGKYLFVNADCPKGQLVTEILDINGEVITDFGQNNCMAIQTDNTCHQVIWVGESGSDISQLENKPIRLRFRLLNGKLYSFWVSPDKNGASNGYVAAGGPGFTGPIDNVGKKTLEWKEWKPE